MRTIRAENSRAQQHISNLGAQLHSLSLGSPQTRRGRGECDDRGEVPLHAASPIDWGTLLFGCQSVTNLTTITYGGHEFVTSPEVETPTQVSLRTKVAPTISIRHT